MEGHKDVINSIAFSPDGERLVSGSFDTSIRLWDVETGANLLTMPGNKIWGIPVAFSPDGKRLVSGAWDNDDGNGLRIWDALTGDHVLTITGHDDAVPVCGVFA